MRVTHTLLMGIQKMVSIIGNPLWYDCYPYDDGHGQPNLYLGIHVMVNLTCLMGTHLIVIPTCMKGIQRIVKQTCMMDIHLMVPSFMKGIQMMVKSPVQWITTNDMMVKTHLYGIQMMVKVACMMGNTHWVWVSI